MFLHFHFIRLKKHVKILVGKMLKAIRVCDFIHLRDAPPKWHRSLHTPLRFLRTFRVDFISPGINLFRRINSSVLNVHADRGPISSRLHCYQHALFPADCLRHYYAQTHNCLSERPFLFGFTGIIIITQHLSFFSCLLVGKLDIFHNNSALVSRFRISTRTRKRCCQSSSDCSAIRWGFCSKLW